MNSPENLRSLNSAIAVFSDSENVKIAIRNFYEVTTTRVDNNDAYIRMLDAMAHDLDMHEKITKSDMRNIFA